MSPKPVVSDCRVQRIRSARHPHDFAVGITVGQAGRCEVWSGPVNPWKKEADRGTLVAAFSKRQLDLLGIKVKSGV